MRIQELEIRTGLDRATIRYYEKEEMITPQRRENGYRDYSEQDAQHLLKIKLLRQLGMSIERIRQLQQGSTDLMTALNERIAALTQQSVEIQNNLAMCRQMQADDVSYSTMDAARYLAMLSKGIPGSNQPRITHTYSERIERPYHPFQHLFARIADLCLVALVIDFVQIVIFRAGIDTMIINPFGFLYMLCFVPLEALFYCLFAATPGKLLFGIRVLHVDGCKHSYRSACRRAGLVFRYGLGFSIPIYRLYRLWVSFKQHDGGEHPWNEESEIIYEQSSRKQIIAWIAAVIFCAISIFLCVKYLNVPPNYDENLTIQEYSENFNYYWEINGGQEGEGMDSLGKFIEPDDNVVVINPLNKGFASPEFRMDGTDIAGFIIDDTFPYNKSGLRPLKRYQIAILAFLGSNLGQTPESVTAFNEEVLETIRKAGNSPGKEFVCENDVVCVAVSIAFEGESSLVYSGGFGMLRLMNDAEESAATIRIDVQRKK